MAKVCALIHGLSGVGKSPLADTAPGPRLILDAEGGAEWTPSPKIYWDPAFPPPTGLTPDQSVVVMVRDFDTIRMIYNWLSAGNHEFESVVFDSLTEIQQRCKDDIGNTDTFSERQWGELLNKMTAEVRRYRDLKFHPVKPINVFFVALSVMKDGQQRADLQGAVAGKMPGYTDFVGYLFTSTEAEGLVRRLLIQPIPGFQAKDRTTRLTAVFGQSIVTHGTPTACDLSCMVGVVNGVPCG